jgi:hypothetical protein
VLPPNPEKPEDAAAGWANAPNALLGLLVGATVAVVAGFAPNALDEPNALCPNAPPVLLAGLAPNALCPNAPPVAAVVEAPANGCPKAEVLPNAEVPVCADDGAAIPVPLELPNPVAPNALEPAAAGAPKAEVDPNADAGFTADVAACPNADCPNPAPAGGTVVVVAAG